MKQSPAANFQVSPPHKSHGDVLSSSSNNLWQRVWCVVSQGSSAQLWSLEYWGSVSHVVLARVSHVSMQHQMVDLSYWDFRCPFSWVKAGVHLKCIWSKWNGIGHGLGHILYQADCSRGCLLEAGQGQSWAQVCFWNGQGLSNSGLLSKPLPAQWLWGINELIHVA